MMAFRRSGPRVLCALLWVVLAARSLESGGVLAVAGPSGFNPSVVGKPITWASASLTYYTDQGDLSPLLPQTAANDFVADAFSRWTSVPSAALTVTRGGALAEDVSGANVFVSGGTLTMPTDIQPSATHRPLGVIYDPDGTVTDALLGAGAGSATFCATNSVTGGADSYTLDANFAHALIVLNGNCAQQSGDLVNLKYRLVRLAGRILGVGWSQVNDNVRTGTPPPTTGALLGFPVMHPRGPQCSGPITGCIPDPDQLRMDDRAAIAYLYPAPVAPTARVRGSIFFANERGLLGQPMQGVNVVARRLDPISNTPSDTYVTASVSGFRFRGSNGNPVTGLISPQGEPFSKFGSDDPALQGYFDLPGLEIPEGAPFASYQIALEPLNPLYKGDAGVGAFRYGVVAPSGTVAPIAVVNLAAGSDVVQNIVVSNSARVAKDTAEPNPFSAPAPVPLGGAWWSSLSGYGDSDFYYFRARPGRTFHLRVTALDESYVSTALKAQPTIGLWQRGASAGSPPLLFASAFNSTVNGQTKLSASASTDSDLMIGIADTRGDGRPDFRYHARLLYADTVTPERIPSGGGSPVQIQGYGFHGNTTVTIGGQAAPILARGSSRLLVQPPVLGNGSANVVVTDLGTGDAVTITNGLRYGVITGDQLQLVASGNPGVPVGTDAPNPIRVRVTTADGVTPIANAPVTYSVAPAQSTFVACGANPCVLSTDERGEAATQLSVRATGENAITISIASGAQVQGTVVGNSPATSISAAVPFRRVPLGASMAVPLSVRVMHSGIAAPGEVVNFSFGSTPQSGSATLAASSIVTNSAGDAVNLLSVSALGSGFTVLACVAGGSPCVALNIIAVPESDRRLQVLRGAAQVLSSGQGALPIVVRVTQTDGADLPIKGATVSVTTAVFARLRSADCGLQNVDCQPASARPLATSFTTLTTDDNGLITLTPAIQPSWGAANLYLLFSVGSAAGQSQQAMIQVIK